MTKPTRQLHRRAVDWLLDSQMEPYIDAFTHYLSERRYSSHTTDTYFSCIAHFARWMMSQCQLDVHRLDEEVVRQFLEDQLLQCDCARPVRRTLSDLRAALRHLLVVLRANAVIAKRETGPTPVDQELRRFDECMEHVCGLAPETRSTHLRTARRLLLEKFGDRLVVLSIAIENSLNEM